MASSARSRRTPRPIEPRPIEKVPTGIGGFDDLTTGGIPLGRPTLVAGGPGCGKTLFGLEFVVAGATRYGEPGVFIAFEESEEELAQNVASLGHDLPGLVADGMLVVDCIRIERGEIEETGEYDLEGLFIRLGHAIDQVGARRVVLDTLEALFAAIPNQQILRNELRRLFRWLKDRGVTAIVTAEADVGDGITQHRIEEYVSDCVVILDHRVAGQVSTRRLRIVKYRGSAHGTNEYPFLIDGSGFTVLPITSMGLDHRGYSTRVSSGLRELDDMLSGGYFKGSSVLVSGTPGSGKTSLACHFAEAACARGERCLYFPFEESPDQIVRNMRSIGRRLGRWVADGRLRFHAARPEASGLETHLAMMQREIDRVSPSVVVIDPITNLVRASGAADAQAMLARVIDLLKGRGITALCTSLTSDAGHPEMTEVGVSSMMDAWLLLRNLESGGERNRGLYILKARGTNHSNQIREFRLTKQGLRLLDVYQGLTGAARLAQESHDREATLRRSQAAERSRRGLERQRQVLEARIEAMRAEFAALEYEHTSLARDADRLEEDRSISQAALGTLRAAGTLNGHTDPSPPAGARPRARRSNREVTHGHRR